MELTGQIAKCLALLLLFGKFFFCYTHLLYNSLFYKTFCLYRHFVIKQAQSVKNMG